MDRLPTLFFTVLFQVGVITAVGKLHSQLLSEIFSTRMGDFFFFLLCTQATHSFHGHEWFIGFLCFDNYFADTDMMRPDLG